MTTIAIAVHGALGRMGREVIRAATDADDMRVVGAADGAARADSVIDLPDGSGKLPVANDIAQALDDSDANVIVDFSSAEGAMASIRAASSRGVAVVVGATGLSEDDYAEADTLAREGDIGVIIAPNFAMGAVLMIHLVEEAARFFDYADLTEMHHEAKIDAPSGTALAIAAAAASGKPNGFTNTPAEKELIPGPRGGDYSGISVHSARMPGRMAHHELVLGALGQTLTIRHDSINRESFMPGVTMAVREVVGRKGLTVGLEKIMGLG